MKWLHRRVWYRVMGLDLGLSPARGTNFCGGSPNWCIVEQCIQVGNRVIYGVLSYSLARTRL